MFTDIKNRTFGRTAIFLSPILQMHLDKLNALMIRIFSSKAKIKLESRNKWLPISISSMYFARLG